MRTNIVLDDGLVDSAFKYAHVHTKKELVHVALEEFVKNHSRRDLRDLKGKITFRKGYDHRKLRQGRS